MTTPANIIEAMTSPDWWGPWFARGDWSRWHVFFKALYGLPMSADELVIFRDFTGRTDPPLGRCQEAYADVGRRGGKTRAMATNAAWLAAFEDWRPYLSPGETAYVLLVAKDQAQASVAFGYLASLFLDHPVLKQLVTADTADSLTLSNRVTVRVAAASFRGLRGFAIAALLADELAYWFDGEVSANPAEEILAAVRPAMLQFQGRAMLLCGSSPYRRTGPLWEAFRRHYGQPSPVLFWKAPTTGMNPQAPADEIARAYEEDPQKAAAEYGAEFRTDLAGYVASEVVEALIELGCFERPPMPGISYCGSIDVSGGSQDSMAMAIAHLDPDGTAILDLVREIRPPFSPEWATAEFADVCRSYGVVRITGDRYGGEWPREAFSRYGIAYETADRTKSDYYRDLLPALNSGKVSLIDNRRLITQLVSLERRVARGGRDSIDHQPGGRDDVANAAAIALVLAAADDAPALWHRDDLRTDGAAIPWPKRCTQLFATATVDQRGVFVGLWAAGVDRYDPKSGARCLLVDYQQSPLSPTLFTNVKNRLAALAAEVKSADERADPIHEQCIAVSSLTPHAAAAGLTVIDADPMLAPGAREALLLAAATEIGMSQVKVATPAELTARHLPLPIGEVRLDAMQSAAGDCALLGVGGTLPREMHPPQWEDAL